MEFRVGPGVVRVNVADQPSLLAAMGARLAAGEGFAVATLNLDHLVKLRADAAFRAAYAAQDFVTADGRPVAAMARLAGRPAGLVTGSDLVRPALRLAAAAGAPVGFLGSTAASLEVAAVRLRREVAGLDVRAAAAPPMGFDPDGEDARRLLDGFAAAGVRVAFLALGAPKQERLAALGRARHPSMGLLCVGAGLDFVSGAQRRAPGALRRAGLEWLWRLAGDPRRLGGRYGACALALPGHAGRALAARFTPSA